MATTVVAVAESGGSMGGLGYPGLLETRRSASDVHSRLFCFFLLASVVSAAVADDGGAGSGGLGGSGGRKLGQWRPWILRFRWCCEPSDERERPSSIVARDFSVLLGDIGSGGFGGGGARSGGTGGIGGSSAVLRSLPTDSSFPAFFAVVVLVKSVIGVTSFSCSSLFVTSSSSPSSNSAILKNEIGWFDDTNNTSSMLSSRLESDATLLRTIVVDRSTILLQNVGLVVASFIIAFMLNWRITLVVLATYPLIICGHISEKLFMKGYGGNLSKAYLKANMLAGEAVSNIRTVAAFCSEEKVLDLYANELVDPSKNSFRRGQIAGIFYGISQFFIFSSYGLALWYGSVLMYKELASFKSVMKSFMVLIVTALAMGETLALAPDLLKGNQMVASVFEVMDRKTGIIGDVGEELKTVEGTIELKRIHFGYPSRPDVIIFKDFNLLVPSGKSIALVGQSGSGKSSVISLILRFYDPTSGKVMIDGKDVRRLNLKSLRKHIGLVQQEPALFATSIYENILYGKEGASDSEVIEAAKLANAHNFISGLPEGYSTKVGERGVQLSGGQRQRVAIARAVLKNPEILLLDEATSALDVESERVVQQALDRLMQNRTTVIVAHRLSVFDGIEGYWWTICAGQFWNARGTPEAQRLLEADNAFTGQALNWFRLWRRLNSIAEWMTFEIAFLHRYQLNFRHVLPEISWNEVSDLDLALEEIKACLQIFQQPPSVLPNPLQQQQQQEEKQIQWLHPVSSTIPESHQPHEQQKQASYSDLREEVSGDGEPPPSEKEGSAEKPLDLEPTKQDMEKATAAGAPPVQSSSDPDFNATDPLAVTENEAEAATCDAGGAMASGDPMTADDEASAEVTQNLDGHQLWHCDMVATLAVGSVSGVHHASSSQSTLLLVMPVPHTEKMDVTASDISQRGKFPGDAPKCGQVPMATFQGSVTATATFALWLLGGEQGWSMVKVPVVTKCGVPLAAIHGDRREPWLVVDGGDAGKVGGIEQMKREGRTTVGMWFPGSFGQMGQNEAQVSKEWETCYTPHEAQLNSKLTATVFIHLKGPSNIFVSPIKLWDPGGNYLYVNRLLSSPIYILRNLVDIIRNLIVVFFFPNNLEGKVDLKGRVMMENKININRGSVI